MQRGQEKSAGLTTRPSRSCFAARLNSSVMPYSNPKGNHMENIEDLKKRKEYLELQREISKLERSSRINKVFNYLPYKITIPLALFGMFLVAASFNDRAPQLILPGMFLIAPTALKFFSKKSN